VQPFLKGFIAIPAILLWFVAKKQVWATIYDFITV